MTDEELTKTQLVMDFDELKLIDANECFKRWFADFMQDMKVPLIASIQVQEKLAIAGANGYLNNGFDFPSINLRGDRCTYSESEHTIQFAHERDFLTFVHEASHFRHFEIDGGECKCPRLEGLVIPTLNDMQESQRFAVEYEAAYRAMISGVAYGFPKGAALAANLSNLLNFAANPDEAQKWYHRAMRVYDEDKAYIWWYETLREFIADTSLTLDDCYDISSVKVELRPEREAALRADAQAINIDFETVETSVTAVNTESAKQ